MFLHFNLHPSVLRPPFFRRIVGHMLADRDDGDFDVVRLIALRDEIGAGLVCPLFGRLTFDPEILVSVRVPTHVQARPTAHDLFQVGLQRLARTKLRPTSPFRHTEDYTVAMHFDLFPFTQFNNSRFP